MFGHMKEDSVAGFVVFLVALSRPEWTALLKPAVWIAGATIAVAASIETLLSLQAVDRLDPLKRHSPPDRELLAQGAVNPVSGFLGGLPVTVVIVRSSANVAAGGRERFSALVYGVLLLGTVLFARSRLNRIPLACLAAVLIQVGLNLCKPALFTTQVKLGMTQVLPFAITIAAVLAFDLLKGVIVGIFVSKPGIVSTLEEVDDGDTVVIDGTGEYIDHDVKEVLATFIVDAQVRNINVIVRGIDLMNAAGGGGH